MTKSNVSLFAFALLRTNDHENGSGPSGEAGRAANA